MAIICPLDLNMTEKNKDCEDDGHQTDKPTQRLEGGTWNLASEGHRVMLEAANEGSLNRTFKPGNREMTI